VADSFPETHQILSGERVQAGKSSILRRECFLVFLCFVSTIVTRSAGQTILPVQSETREHLQKPLAQD